MSLQNFFDTYKVRIQKVLEKLLIQSEPAPKELTDAMLYTVLGGGKRLRPMLAYAAGLSFDASEEHLDFIAASVELIHIYSLIHDDLPALDNDDLRHGRPSCHKQFDEATAIICGDALQSLAFEILSYPWPTLAANRQLLLIQKLAKAIGVQGMAGGQILDMQAEKKHANLNELETIHRLKTGALLQCAIEMGALAGTVNLESELPMLQKYALHLGLMFQIHDDILDVTSTTEKLGKPQGSDIARDKSTYPALLGLEKAVELAWNHYHLAMESIQSLKGRDVSILESITTFMIERDH